MADDALRGDLFGGARIRNASKPNPYANISNPFETQPAAVEPPVASDPHDQLLSGGRNTSARPNESNIPVPASVATTLVPETIPEDDGLLSLDYLDDLNLTEGHQRTDGEQSIQEIDFDEIDNDLVRI